MPEFHLVQTIQAPLPGPTQCFFCGDFVGPFINTNTESPGHGGVYICAPNDRRTGCIGQMAQLAGYVDGQQLVELADMLDHQAAELNEVRQERDDLLQLKEISSIVKKRQERRMESNGDDVTPKERKPSKLASYASTVTFTPGGEVGKRP